MGFVVGTGLKNPQQHLGPCCGGACPQGAPGQGSGRRCSPGEVASVSPGLKPNLGSSSRCHFKAKMGQHWSDLDKEPFFLANEKPGVGLNILVDPFQLGVFFDSMKIAVP